MGRTKRNTGSDGRFGRRVQRTNDAPEQVRVRRWPLVVAMLGIFLIALFVRFYGLSHDLDEGNIYHPDTPKQIDAAHRFLKGHYYYRSPKGSRDIDGYPYFNMHLVEYEWRGISGMHAGLAYVMGWRREVVPAHEYPDVRMTLFVLTRLSVCILSALVVLVIYRIGRETWGPAVGLIGAGLAALSPLSVEIAHYGMSDSVMDLFVCLTILAALRMYKSPRWIYAALAGFLGALAFAAKYNGGVVLVFVGLLHVLKYASVKKFFSRQGVRDAGLLVAGTLVGLFLAIPSLFVYPDLVIKGIAKFSSQASRYRELPPEVAGSWWGLFRYAAARNLATLMRCAGWLVPIGAAVGFVVSGFRNRRHLLVGLFPLLYIGLVLIDARHIKPYYFSIAILIFCVYFAVLVEWLSSLKRLRIPGRVLGAMLVLAAVLTYGVRVARSDFFFWHMSSRRVATAWVNENIPELFKVATGDKSNYALYAAGRSEEDTIETLALVTDNIHLDYPPVPKGSVTLNDFQLESKQPITVFRNPNVRVSLLEGSKHLRTDFSMPVYQRIPSATGNEFVFPLGVEFLHSGRTIPLRSRTRQRIFVIPEAPEEVVIALRNGSIADLVTVSFGGSQHTVGLKPLETKTITVNDPKRMALIGRPFYRFSAQAPFVCQAEVAVTDEQKGVLYYNAGRYEEALPHLVAAWRERPGPALAQMAVIAAASSGADLDAIEHGPTIVEAVRADLDGGGRSLFDRFGISAMYLEHLAYIEREVEDFAGGATQDAAASGDACVMPDAGTNGEWSITLGDLFLEPGAYRITLTARAEPGASDDVAVRVSCVDPTGEVVYDTATVSLAGAVGDAYTDVTCSLQWAGGPGPVALKIAADAGARLRFDRVKVEPDIARAVQGRDRLARAMLDGQVADLRPELQDREPLLAYGNSAALRGDSEHALAIYEKAAEADLSSYKPYAAMRRILDKLPDEQRTALAATLAELEATRGLTPKHPLHVRFKNGLVLSGYRLSSTEYRPGDEVFVTLYWRVRPEEAWRYAGQSVFIHFIPEGRPKHEQAFQGDTDLVPGLQFDERLDRIQPVYRHPIQIPEGTRPGTYEIEAGVLISMHQKRIKVVESDVARTNNSVTIGTLRIVPR